MRKPPHYKEYSAYSLFIIPLRALWRRAIRPVANNRSEDLSLESPLVPLVSRTGLIARPHMYRNGLWQLVPGVHESLGSVRTDFFPTGHNQAGLLCVSTILPFR